MFFKKILFKLNEDEILAKELQDRINQIREENAKVLCKRLAQYHKDLATTQGYLMSNASALNLAVASFLQAKKDGKVDTLNRIVGGEE